MILKLRITITIIFFISLKSNKKGLKLIEYFKSKITAHGILFLQETHSSCDDEQKLRDNFGGNTFFSHGKRNSCGVLISYIGTHNFVVNNQKTDNDGRILILDVTINDVNFVLINLYNANTETEQVSVLNNLSSLLEKFDVTLEKKVILAGDFNLFLNSKLDAKGGKSAIKKKKKSSAKLIQLKESYDLCDIWRIRNPVTSTFTFRQKHLQLLFNVGLTIFLFPIVFKNL